MQNPPGAAITPPPTTDAPTVFQMTYIPLRTPAFSRKYFPIIIKWTSVISSIKEIIQLETFKKVKNGKL